VNGVQLFENGEFELRLAPIADSFKVQAPGLARSLAFHSAKDMLRTLADDEKGWEIAPTPGGEQEMWHVTEPGFYRVIGQRQTARIKNKEIRQKVDRFQRWVYHEVLPSIRRYGSYPLTQDAPRAIGRKITYADSEILSFDEAMAVYFQERGGDFDTPYFTRVLRAAGYLRQGGCVPRKKKRKFFFFNGGSWEIRTWALPLLFFEFEQTMQELSPRPWNQPRLDEGLARPVMPLKRGES